MTGTVITLPIALPTPSPAQLDDLPVLDRWRLLSGGDCPTIVGFFGASRAPSYIEIASYNPAGGYARRRKGGLIRLGEAAS